MYSTLTLGFTVLAIKKVSEWTKINFFLDISGYIAGNRMRDISFSIGEVLGARQTSVAKSTGSWSSSYPYHPASLAEVSYCWILSL